jgi:hypothetical protein
MVLAAAALFGALSSGSAAPSGVRADVVSARPTSAAPSGVSARPAAVDVLNVGGTTRSPPVPSGFSGLALEQPSLEKYAGSNPGAIDPVFEQLVRNLDPGQRLVLRIAGDSTDWDWYPVQGMKQPPWVRYTLTPNWLAVARALASDLDARLILGINLEAGSAEIARAEGSAMIKMIGRASIDALELGNEPELYAGFNWYRTKAGVGVPGRPSGWDFAKYSQQFGAIARKLPAVPLTGPATGSLEWAPPSALGPFLAAHPQVRVVTLHRYPLVNCSTTPHLTAAQLLSTSSSVGLADSVARYVLIARHHGVPLRIDEMNTISCRGQLGLSNSFATALWSLDALFAMAKVGVSGVNFQTTAKAPDTPFSMSETGTEWTGTVNPLYYGLVTFAQAAPAGSRLLQITGQLGPSVRAWATLASNGSKRVLLVNTAPARSETITLGVSGVGANGSLERLRAPRLGATGGVTLAGQSFAAHTATGLLSGKRAVSTVTASHGRYVVALPAASAALLTFTRTPYP